MLIVIVDDPTGSGVQFSVLPLVLRRGLGGATRRYKVRNDSGCDVEVTFDTAEIDYPNFWVVAGAEKDIEVDAAQPVPLALGKTKVGWTLTKKCLNEGSVTTRWVPEPVDQMGRPDLEIDDP